MVDIFDEVEEELRADKAKQMLQRFGGLIIGVCVLIVAGVAGWQGWQYWRTRQDIAAATAYLASLSRIEGAPVLSDDRRQQALTGFEALTKDAPDGYRTLARLQAAALKADSGDLQGAALLWDQVAADSAADPLMRDLASLLWASRQIETGDPSLLEARLRPLITPGNAWRTMAREQLALLLIRQDKADDAKTELRKLTEDTTAPTGVRGRSRALLDRLGG